LFCPVCGRENPSERRYCAGCGTNLETVSQALSGDSDDVFTKFDAGFDHFLARYSEHVFKEGASKGERTVARSWRILWQGAVTSFVDMILFSLMWNILPFRFLILLITTPIRLLAQRGKNKSIPVGLQNNEPVQLPTPEEKWLAGATPVVTEQTTRNLPEQSDVRREPLARERVK
jgi:zinc ribbon protein